MAKTLLNAVNEILKRVGVISGDSGALTTLTDSARQKPIDVAIQVINEAMDELYSMPGISAPQGQGESTITLAPVFIDVLIVGQGACRSRRRRAIAETSRQKPAKVVQVVGSGTGATEKPSPL